MDRLPAIKEYSSRYCKGRPLSFYEQNIIAEYDGVRAGICGLSFKDDKQLYPYVHKQFSAYFVF